MSEKTKKMLEELGKSDYGDVLKEYLKEKLEAIKGNIDNAEDWSDILGRRKASRIIKEVFYFLEEPKQSQPKEKNPYM